MIRSMTGYGRSRKNLAGKDVTVEIKSVNSRFLECSTRVSKSISYLEERVKPYLQSRGISRGKVDVWITVENPTADENVTLDENAARAYLESLYRLRDAFGLKDDISVMTVARNPDLFRKAPAEEDVEKEWNDVVSVLSEAVDAFLAVREREGEKLAQDLLGKLAGIRATVDEIEKISAGSPEKYRERLAAKIREALGDNQITPDETRILTECAIFADRVAIDEELVRLRTHFGAMEQILASGEAVGRKLDFLLQEMNREINTTGSKCADAGIAQRVVDVKCELEKIREQIQNLE